MTELKTRVGFIAAALGTGLPLLMEVIKQAVMK
jgi:hypothetical protein